MGDECDNFGVIYTKSWLKFPMPLLSTKTLQIALLEIQNSLLFAPISGQCARFQGQLSGITKHPSPAP